MGTFKIFIKDVFSMFWIRVPSSFTASQAQDYHGWRWRMRFSEVQVNSWWHVLGVKDLSCWIRWPISSKKWRPQPYYLRGLSLHLTVYNSGIALCDLLEIWMISKFSTVSLYSYPLSMLIVLSNLFLIICSFISPPQSPNFLFCLVLHPQEQKMRSDFKWMGRTETWNNTSLMLSTQLGEFS